MTSVFCVDVLQKRVSLQVQEPMQKCFSAGFAVILAEWVVCLFVLSHVDFGATKNLSLTCAKWIFGITFVLCGLSVLYYGCTKYSRQWREVADLFLSIVVLGVTFVGAVLNFIFASQIHSETMSKLMLTLIASATITPLYILLLLSVIMYERHKTPDHEQQRVDVEIQE